MATLSPATDDIFTVDGVPLKVSLQRAERMRKMRAEVLGNDVHQWLDDFIDASETASPLSFDMRDAARLPATLPARTNGNWPMDRPGALPRAATALRPHG